MLRNATPILKPALPLTILVAMLAGCVTFPPEPGSPVDTAALTRGPVALLPDFTRGLTDQEGGLWRVAVKERYVSASGRECARLSLQRQALAPAQPATLDQVACLQDSHWHMRPDFTGGSNSSRAPTFAPLAAVAAATSF